MKTIQPSSPVSPLPDFSRRPRRVNLDQIVALKGFGKLKIRPISIEDEEEMIRFHRGVSDESIYMRYFEYLGLDRRTSHERLARICANTVDSYAVVVERPSTASRLAMILAVGRLTTTTEPCAANFDTLIADETKAPQLHKLLLARLIKLARAFGFRILTGELLVADHDGLNLCRKLGFTLRTLPRDGLVRATLDL